MLLGAGHHSAAAKNSRVAQLAALAPFITRGPAPSELGLREKDDRWNVQGEDFGVPCGFDEQISPRGTCTVPVFASRLLNRATDFQADVHGDVLRLLHPAAIR